MLAALLLLAAGARAGDWVDVPAPAAPAIEAVAAPTPAPAPADVFGLQTPALPELAQPGLAQPQVAQPQPAQPQDAPAGAAEAPRPSAAAQAAQLAPSQPEPGRPDPAGAARSVFDGGKPAAPAASAAYAVRDDGDANLDGQRQAGAQLLERARPWRTQNQLEALSRSRPPEAGKPFRFAVVGDAEPGRFWIWRKLYNVPGVFARLMGKVKREPVDFVVQLGDMVSRGTREQYARFFQTLSGLAPLKPYLTLIGNHDRRRPHGVTDSKLYRALFGPTDYWFERGGYRFVVVDSSAFRVTPEQLRWLDSALDTPLRKVVFTHMPPATLSEWTDVPGRKGAGGFKQGAREFTRIVAARGVERVYMGHIHAFGALQKDGMRYVLSGGGGSPLFPSPVRRKFHHYLVIEAGPGGLKETVHRADGRSFSLTWPGPSR